jgi:hypothetical protein
MIPLSVMLRSLHGPAAERNATSHALRATFLPVAATGEA